MDENNGGVPYILENMMRLSVQLSVVIGQSGGRCH